MIFLNSLSIAWIDDISFNGPKEIIFNALALDKDIRIRFLGLLYFSMSGYEEPKSREDQWFGDVLEINHKYCTLTPSDFKAYAFSRTPDAPKHVLHVEGKVVIDIICSDIIIDK